jgi:hypothetical protein
MLIAENNLGCSIEIAPMMYRLRADPLDGKRWEN